MLKIELYVINLFGFNYRYEVIYVNKNPFFIAVGLVWYLLTCILETIARRYKPDNATLTHWERLILFTVSYCFIFLFLLGQDM